MQAARAALQRLQLSGYTEENLCRFFRIPVASDARYTPAPPADERPRRALGAWFALWVAGETLPRAAFPAADVDALEAAGLIEATSDDQVRARVSLLPAAGVLVASDRFDAVGAEVVGAPDLSAFNVAHCLPARLDGKRVLDVGCGAGLLALCAAHRGALAAGGDVHLAALAFARRNAELAGLEASFVESDLFAAFGSSRFDLIVFNAPLLRAPLAQSADAPARYTTSPLGESLALRFLDEVNAHLVPGGELLLHAQLTPAVDATLAALAAGASVLQVVFARAPDGTPHALTSVRGALPPGLRRVEVPLSRFCPHLARPVLDALHAPTGADDLWHPAPWLELRDTRRLAAPAERALAFGAHGIDADDLALLQRLQPGNTPVSAVDPSDLARLFRLAALGLLVRR